MKLIFVKHGRQAAQCLDLGSALGIWLATGVIAVLGIAVSAGYFAGGGYKASEDIAEIEALRAELAAQEQQIAELSASADEHIDALALRMGELNAHVIRLNALGSRLTGMAGLEDGEFDFQNPPAMGGSAEPIAVAPASSQLPDLLANIDSLDTALDDQSQQLTALEGLLLNRKLSDRGYPSGRPVNSGWLSSYYGKRADPITGKSSVHKGVDFAGQYGDQIVAVSDGVVSFSGEHYGFGNMVEIRHSNGYLTRYAHNQANLVAVGDKVTQGQPIALMGSTGRSTGPHVHFEVHRNGRPVDPAKYIRNR